MGKMKDAFIDLSITSPPYDDMKDYHGYSLDIDKVAQELFRVTKKGGIVVWVVSEKPLTAMKKVPALSTL
jgi:site-specific DNA-methyltransferase (adenine-specific)